MPSSIERSAPADSASLPEVMTTPFTAASAEVCFTIPSSSLIEVSSSTFIERPGVSHVTSAMPSASVSSLKFLKAMLVAPNSNGAVIRVARRRFLPSPSRGPRRAKLALEGGGGGGGRQALSLQLPPSPTLPRKGGGSRVSNPLDDGRGAHA